MSKINLGVLFGGVSSEYEVSLMSAASVLNHLSGEKYEISPIGITRDGRWFLYEGPAERMVKDEWETAPFIRPAILSPDRAVHGLMFPDGTTRRLDAVFPVLHGRNGEDGRMQGLLELAGIPFVGCGTLASAAAMDKEFTHRLLEQAGIPGARYLCVRKNGADPETVSRRMREMGLGYPVFVKPANAGSSVGVSRAESPEALTSALLTAFREDSKVLVEEAVSGVEAECAVMGNETPIASENTGEIAPERGLYDYDGKYRDQSVKLYIPARISPESAETVRETAVRAYRALDCRGYARVDCFVQENGTVLVNEVNTIPGFTSISMFPKLFCAGGMEYGELLNRLIAYALEGAAHG